MTTLLFLSGASLVGQNVLAALSGRRQHLRLAALNSESREPALYDFDEVYLAPEGRRDPAGYRRRFLDVYGRTAPALVIPCRDEDVLFLARLAEDMPDDAARFLTGSVETASALLDKWHSWVFSQGRDLPFVPTLLCESPAGALREFAGAHGFPLICKPREGFASRGVSLLLNEAHLEQAAGRQGFIVQKYLGDPETIHSWMRNLSSSGVPLFHSFEPLRPSFQTLIGRDGNCLGTCTTGHSMNHGRSEFVITIEQAELSAIGRRCAAAFAEAGWRGPLNVQCLTAPDGRLWIFEYNGRFTGATAARCLLGFDEVGMALAEYAGLALPGVERPRGTSAVKRSLTSRPLDELAIETLRQAGEWCRPSIRSAS